ncbi:MAG: 2-C-methyl-D-erythritol 2,4-cyclodiphosphate synthase, partial [Desulfuromonadales bacterium]|nr:2-C-methyl-D-erythritol 2,4-cyclodiphosphate synthase [Desulfuromonadales bacterium]
MRIGHGYDVHRLVPERLLVLGGVEIPYEYGLLGHSDADVLLHAVSDAVLGALGLGDIGRYFPDTDPTYKGVNSLLLLEHVIGLAQTRGFRVSNLDTTIVAQKPRLAPYVSQMVTNLAKACQVPSGCVN